MAEAENLIETLALERIEVNLFRGVSRDQHGRIRWVADGRRDPFVRAAATLVRGLADGPGERAGNADREVNRVVL